jgi:hypothetical protein
MNYRNIFRILVLLSLVLAVMSATCDFIFPNEVVDKLFAYFFELKPMDIEVDPIDIGLLVLMLVLLLAALSGLLLFKNWGRIAFVLCGVVGFPIIMMSGPYITSGLSGVLYDLSNITSGVILAMMYLSPVSEEFKI